jgi:hypothetical protein
MERHLLRYQSLKFDGKIISKQGKVRGEQHLTGEDSKVAGGEFSTIS